MVDIEASSIFEVYGDARLRGKRKQRRDIMRFQRVPGLSRSYCWRFGYVGVLPIVYEKL